VIPLSQIHQIEVTSRCNLRCRYCVHPTMKRAKQDMDVETFAKSVAWARRLRDRLPPDARRRYSLNLAGIGESTMHPLFIDFLAIARESLGPEQHLVLATNGLLVTDELARAMQPFNPRVYVSLHRPEKAGPAVEALKRVGLLDGVSADAAIAATDWAGQIDWHVSAQKTPCPWVLGGWAIVLSDGRLTRCSFDGTGVGVFGHIDDDLTKLATSPYSLCRACHQDVGLPIQEAEVA
jgi:hypothetical protein